MYPSEWMILHVLLWTIEEMCYGCPKSTPVLQILAPKTGDFLRTREIAGEPHVVSEERKNVLGDEGW